MNRLLRSGVVSSWMIGLGIALGSAQAGDWPQWRGPNRDDVSQETGLLRQWPEGGPTLVWKATGLGAGYSGVAIAGDRVYSMGEKGDTNFAVALNRADGKVLWTTKVGKAGAPGWGGFAGPRCTPTVDGDRLYAVGQYGEMVCLDRATGAEKWRKHYVTDFGGKVPEWGFSESLLVDGDRVVGTPGGPKGAVVALDKATGNVVWQSPAFTDAAEYASLIVVEIGGVRQYIQLTQASVAGIAAKDGRLLWRAERKGKVAVIPTPIYADNHVYVSSGYEVGCNLFKISQQGGQFQAEQVYAAKSIMNHHGGVIKIGDHVYGHCDKGGWTCQEFKTGKVVWKEKDKLGKGAIAYADGHFYLRQEDGKGTVVLLAATPEGFVEHGRFNQPDRAKQNSWPHPVICGGQLYLRDQDVLLCYDVKAK